VDPHHGGGLHLQNGLFVEKLTEVKLEDPDGSAERGPLDEDPALCPDDFLHITTLSEDKPAIHV
jgi:hypothetical protein